MKVHQFFADCQIYVSERYTSFLLILKYYADNLVGEIKGTETWIKLGDSLVSLTADSLLADLNSMWMWLIDQSVHAHMLSCIKAI